MAFLRRQQESREARILGILWRQGTLQPLSFSGEIHIKSYLEQTLDPPEDCNICVMIKAGTADVLTLGSRILYQSHAPPVHWRCRSRRGQGPRAHHKLWPAIEKLAPQLNKNGGPKQVPALKLQNGEFATTFHEGADRWTQHLSSVENIFLPEFINADPCAIARLCLPIALKCTG